MDTLEQAKQMLRDNWKEGTDCPCCHQFVKLYERPITAAMAYGLVLIYKCTDEWVHIENYFKTLNIPSSIRGDVAKLKYWDLIEPKVGLRDDGSKRNGYYRITQRGKDFATGTISVPSHIKLYNQTFYGFDGDYVSIKECLGKKFNFFELMGFELDFSKIRHMDMHIQQSLF